MKWTVGTRIGAGFALALAVLIAIGLPSYRSVNSLIEASGWQTHTHIVLRNLEGALSELKDAETGQRGYIITGQESYLEPYHAAIKEVWQVSGELRKLTADNPNQQRRLDALQSLVASKLDELKLSIDLRKSKGFDAALAVVVTGEGKQTMDDARKLIGEMEDEELNLLKVRAQRVSVDAERAISIIVYGVPLALVLLAIAGFLITRNISNPLKKLEFFARGVAETGFGTSRAEAAGSFEVASLAQSINRMLDRLKQEHDKQDESERRVRALLDNMSEGIVSISETGMIELFNPAAERLFGYRSEEVIGRNAAVLMPEPYHSDYDGYLGRYLRTGQALTSGRELTGRRSDGSVFSMDMRITEFSLEGRRQFIGGIRDITERKQAEEKLKESEERLKRALDGSRLALWDYDLSSGKIYLSETWSELLGGPSVATMTTFGQLVTVVPVEDQAVIVAAMVPAIKGQQAGYQVEHRVRRLDGENIWILSEGRVVERDTDGRAQRAIGINRDITERTEAEAARASLEAQLRESQKMEAMGTLAGGVAHDFNNILAAIRGNTMLAKNDLQARPDDALVSLEEIDKAAKRAKDLVQQILIFSRKGVQTFAVQPVRPLVEEAIRLLRSTLPAGVELAAELAEAPLYASVDASQIEQVLINLCTNACHAMKGNAGRIEVGLTEVLLDQTPAQGSPDLHAGQYLRIRVSDNGDGMDAATQGRIFEPFFTTKGVGVGTGLGLSVVHGIVKAHQGAITVESTPGKGTTFLVYLPAAAAPARAERVADAAPASVDGQGKHVLYVDDDASIVFLVSRLLEKAGYRVSGFDRGAAALEAVRADPEAFDLIVTDFNMPGLSGLQVAEELRRIRPGLPVVIASGYITGELTAGARAAGVRQVVYKPDTVDELCRTIRQLLPIETGQT